MDIVFRVKPVNEKYSALSINSTVQGFNTWNGWQSLKSNGWLENFVIGLAI